MNATRRARIFYHKEHKGHEGKAHKVFFLCASSCPLWLKVFLRVLRDPRPIKIFPTIHTSRCDVPRVNGAVRRSWPRDDLGQVFQIGQIFESPRSLFIGFQMRQVNDVDFNPVKRIHDSTVEAFLKFHARNAS